MAADADVTVGADAWCRALADTILPEDVSAGRAVRLDCSDGAVAAAGRLLGIPPARAVSALIACLHHEHLVDRDSGVGPLARARAGHPPRFLLGTAVLVLAASRMASDEVSSMAAYYRRLGELLGIPLQPTWPQVRGVPELVSRFSDLAEWMRRHECGRRGLLDLPADVHPGIVGVPIKQSLLRAGDRNALGAFFERASRLIDAGWDPVHQLARWGGRHRLTTPLQTLLETPGMHSALAAALRAARRAWDGSTIDASGRRLLPGQLALHLPPLPFTLSITVPALSAPVRATGPAGAEISLDAQAAAAVSLEWLSAAAAGPVIVDAGEDRIRVLDGPTMLFEITTLGVQAVAAAAEDPVWVLTCEPQLIVACEDTRRFPAPLPPGWVLLCDVEPELLRDDLRASRDDEERPLGGVHALGGLRLAQAVWLLDHPPHLSADLSEPAPVTVDGAAHGDIEPGQILALDSIGHHVGVHRLEVGEQGLTVEIAARGDRDGVGSLGFDAHPRRMHTGPTVLVGDTGPRIIGPLTLPAPDSPPPRSLIVRYRCPVDVIDTDGSVRTLGPPTPATWLDHVGLPQDGPWEIPDFGRVVWACVDAPGRKFIVAHQAVDVPLSDDVLDIVEWHADAQRIIDRTDGQADGRWQRLVAALEEAG